MDNLRKYVIKTLAWMAVLVLVLGLPMSAGAACAHENTYYYLVQPATCCQDGIYDLRCKDCSAKLQKNAAVVGATGDHPGTDVEIKNPRCLTDGEARFYCTLSGKLVKTEVIDQLGHKMESIGKDEPTCTEKGTIYLRCIRCRATSEAVIPENGHHFTASMAMAETCTTDGKYERLCGECGYVEVEIVPATGHTLKSVAKVPSDCEREGLETLECQNPGCKHSETRIVPKKDHDLKTVSVSDPTCEAGGQVTWQCTYCGFETQTLGKPALGHSMTGGAVKKNPTCEEDGYYRVHCSRCDYYEEEIYPAEGHFTAAEYVPSTCEKEGYRREACGNCDYETYEVEPKKDHDLKTYSIEPAGCESGERVTWRCTMCGFETYTVGAPAKGHSMTGGAEEVPATCEKDGYCRVYCSGCDYYEEEIYPAKGHFTAAEYVPSTCEKEGYRREACGNCDYETYEVLPKKDHDLKTYGALPADCERGESITWRCTVCGFETQTLGKPALGHSMTGGAEEVPATCEEDGYYRVHCSRCDYYEEEIYPAEGHFTAAEYVPSTCEKEGYRREACGNCDYETYEVVPKKDHDLKTYGALPADCERGESITWRCTACGFETQTLGKPALGHSMTGGAEDVPATCGKDGYYRVHCSRCDYYEEEIYPAKSHHFRSTGEKKDPTCDEAGYAVIACTHCGYSFKATLPALGHEMGTAVSVCSTCVKQGYFKQECTRCDYKDYILYTLVPHTWMESIASSSESRFVYYFKECSVCGASNVIRYRK